MAVAVLGRGALAQGIADGIPADAGPGGIATTTTTATGPADTGTTGGPAGAAPSVLPATGVGVAAPDVRLGNLAIQSAPGGGVPQQPRGGRAWTITPQATLTEEYSSNGTGLGSGTSGRGEFISILQPSVAITGDTVRLHGELFYAPQIEFFTPDGNQNQVNQNFNGRLLATLVPQTLFLDLRGSGAISAIAAGQAPPGTTNLGRSNTSQNYNFSASPYALHRFGTWGTGELGASISRTTQNVLQPNGPQSAALAALADATNQNATTYDGHLAFTTGEALGRYYGAALAQASRTEGTGVLDGAYRDVATLDNGFAVTRGIAALAAIGYERIHYAGSNPVHISDAIWNAGVRLTPNADSSITVRYGHQDGFNSWTLDAGYAPTARTRIYARYSSGLTTFAELLQSALATSDLDAQGNPIDHTTGAPLVPVGNFFGTQNSLFRTSTASVTGVLTLERDSVALGINNQSQKLVSASNAEGQGLGGNHGTYGSLNWLHQLRPDLQSTLYGQYGVTTLSGVTGGEQLIVLSASLSYAISQTLSGTVQYSYNRTFGANPAPGDTTAEATGINTDQSLVLVSLTKSF